MKPIPVLGIPHYNRPDLTVRCLASIDYPVETLVVVFNNDQLQFGELAQIQSAMQAAEHLKRVECIFHPNAGVAGAWNEIIKLFPAPWWLISNNDIAFAPGDLQKMAEFIDPCLGCLGWLKCGECGQLFTAEQFNANAGYCPHCCPTAGQRPDKKLLDAFKPGVVYGNHGASWFGITAHCVERVGLFDENIYPAYLEDCDYARRCDLLAVARTDVPGVNARHGDEQLTGSCTIHSDPALAVKNARTHGGNFDYYRAKWGGINGEEKFPAPFNSPHWPVWAWKFDPAFRARNQW